MRARLSLLTLVALIATFALTSCGAKPTSGAACPLGATIPPLELSSVGAVVTLYEVDQLRPSSAEDWYHTSAFLRVLSATVS